jgi:5'-nucleotidase
MRTPARPAATRPGRLRTLVILAAVAAAVSACGSSASSSSSTTVPPANQTLRVLVTNDDGFSAPGIDAAVQALRTLPHTQVTVVAPFANQSGTGGKTTPGTLTVTSGMTSSGYPAKAVHGYPADTIIWAIDNHGISFRPELVVSGINFGQNIGPLASGSGTVGAAQAALARGIPALAVSQGIDNSAGPNFSQGAHQLLDWVKANRTTLLSHPSKKSLPSGNMNVPTCANGNIRGPVHVPLATSLSGVNLGTVDCSSTATDPPNDVVAFSEGFAAIAPLSGGS